jgi:hypothetical protein
MTPKQRRLLRWVAERLELGDPADYTAPGGVRWLVWDDPRIDLQDIAALGTVGRLLAQIDANVVEPPDGSSPRQAIRDWVKNNWDLTTPPSNDPNPYQWVLTKNGAPAAIQAGSSVPTGWTPT